MQVLARIFVQDMVAQAAESVHCHFETVWKVFICFTFAEVMMADQIGYFVVNQQNSAGYNNAWNFSQSVSVDSDYRPTIQELTHDEIQWNNSILAQVRQDGHRRTNSNSQSSEIIVNNVNSDDNMSWDSTPPISPYNASPGSSGIYSPPPPKDQFQTSGEYFRACVEYDR